jgi:glycerol-3-phosphate acyltransferase PlsY
MVILGLLAAFICGYAFGCIPFAFLAMKVVTGIDVRTVGTGNVGARNAWEQSGNHLVGGAAFLGDVLKGVIAILVVQAIFPTWFAATAVAGVGVIAGHNFNVFLGFKGGRGLAPAVGVAAATIPVLIIVWGVMYLTGYYVIRRNVHVASLAGTIGAAIIMASVPDRVIWQTSLVWVHTPMQMRLMIIGILFLIMLRHIEPVKEEMAKDSEEEV